MADREQPTSFFGKWDDSFDWLYRFKAEVEIRSPGTIVEIATEEIDGKIHFSRFFLLFQGSHRWV